MLTSHRRVLVIRTASVTGGVGLDEGIRECRAKCRSGLDPAENGMPRESADDLK